jgi:hypothetical protein
MPISKPATGIVAVLAAIVIVAIAVLVMREREPEPVVTNYDECVAAGYPVAESYPPQCFTPDGRSFTQDIGNELDMGDKIFVSTPRPNALVSSPMLIEGEARGFWYFEASFPARLYDANGKEIAVMPVMTTHEWMTEEFVPFSVEMDFPEPETATGTLVLERDNPSGLPEYDESLRIPIKFR